MEKIKPYWKILQMRFFIVSFWFKIKINEFEITKYTPEYLAKKANDVIIPRRNIYLNDGVFMYLSMHNAFSIINKRNIGSDCSKKNTWIRGLEKIRHKLPKIPQTIFSFFPFVIELNTRIEIAENVRIEINLKAKYEEHPVINIISAAAQDVKGG